MSALPIRDLADVPLAELFESGGAGGCPLCLRAEAMTDRFIDAMLYESVNDVAFRRELDAARGFCRRHVHELLAANRARTGSLSTAILLRAMLLVRRRELESALAGGRSRGRRLAEASRGPDCPICRRVEVGLRAAASSLVRLSADPAWASAPSGAPFCLEHLVLLAGEPRHPPGWDRVEASQLERLASVEERVGRFIHHSSEDRRQLLTDDERGSVDDVARLLGGGGSAT